MTLRSIIISLVALMLANSALAEVRSQFLDDSDNISFSPKEYFSQLLNENELIARPYLEISAGSQPGVNQSYSTLGVMTYLPVYDFSKSSRLWSYIDTCWYHFLKGTNGASVEEGLIWQTNYGSFGGYLGYDWRRWSNHSFNQISCGLLMTWCNWNLGFNLNYPLENEHIICAEVFNFEGGFQASVKNFDATYRTYSLVIGHSFCTCWPFMVVSAGLEPYYIATNSRDLCGCKEKSWGGQARFLLEMCHFFHAEILLSRDEIFNSRAQITIGIDLLSLFSDCPCDCPCDYPFYPIFQRQKIVPLKHKESWRHNW